MIPDGERRLADDIADRTDEARLARQWSNVSRRLTVRPRRQFFIMALAPAVVIALAALALLIVRPWRAEPAVARAPDALQLPDGSRAQLSGGAEVMLESATRDRVHLVLSAGAIELDVTHVEGRSFVVTAAGHDVTVLGTAFTVRLDSTSDKRSLSVEVRRGRVRVDGPSGEHILDAGQSWSTRIDGTTALAAPPLPVVAPSALAVAADEPSSAPAPDPIEPRVAGEPSARPAAPAAVEGPRELLARATDARAAGRPRDAAIALDTLRKRYRSDARAGIAAFELGRVRLDALHDPGGAAEAFADAMALSPSGPFREDAEARRVEALDALPDRSRCERARDAYLAHYPTGLHAKQIAIRCKRP